MQRHITQRSLQVSIQHFHFGHLVGALVLNNIQSVHSTEVDKKNI